MPAAARSAPPMRAAATAATARWRRLIRPRARRSGSIWAPPDPTSCAPSARSTPPRRRFARRAKPMSAEPTTPAATGDVKTINVKYLTRAEGEGAWYLKVRDGQVADVQFRIFEPPRYFEALLRGRRYDEAPDITARICGICPVAYQM